MALRSLSRADAPLRSCSYTDWLWLACLSVCRVPVVRRSLWRSWLASWSWHAPRNTSTTLWWTISSLNGSAHAPPLTRWPTVWVKKYPPWGFLTFFPKRLGIFSPNFTHLLHVPIYARVQLFIQLPTTLTKLRHIKCDHPANFYISLEL